MVSINVDGEDKTKQISDWEIVIDSQNKLILHCHFPSGKIYRRPLSCCKIDPTEMKKNQLLSRDGGVTLQQVDSIEIFGKKYAAIQYPGNSKIYLMKFASIKFYPATSLKKDNIFNYFVSIAKARVTQGNTTTNPIAENVLRQLEKTLPYEQTALHAYCTGYGSSLEGEGRLIYPFGINKSQMTAVKRAFRSQISLIEGPPGTGKTQTILNIIANIVLRGKTVAVVSNNNAAVENVYEKLNKKGLDYLVAKLGSQENRTKFFNALPARPLEAPAVAPSLDQIQTILKTLEKYLHAENELARLQAEIAELNIERTYLQQWWDKNQLGKLVDLDKYKLTPQKTSDLRAYLAYLAENRIKLKNRFELFVKFKMLRMKPFSTWEKRKSLFYSLQLHYYDQALKEKKVNLASQQDYLRAGNYDALHKDLVDGSMACFKKYLQTHISKQDKFDSKEYTKNITQFLKRFPIIGSGTHSLINSLTNGTVLDYVIIDEASQQDIIPGILPLSCAKNLIVVGDRKQLPHVPTKLGIAPPAPFYDCEKYSLLDSCIGIFKDSIPITLLKEHYRCHPKIIQFCNQQFYDNQLIPMTQDDGEKPLELIITAKGNHRRGNTNYREIESLPEAIHWNSAESRGFIAPYNAQIRLSEAHLPTDFINATVHKFQGRECDEMVFSTVLNKKLSSQRNLDFVDNPHLVNVAVSRAKNKFTLVTGDDVFTSNNRHIAALVRYLKYYADEEQIQFAPIISAFDLLYAEYDQSLEKLKARLQPNDSRFKSEQIMAQILRETLANEACKAITFHSQIDLIQLVSVNHENLTLRERDFMRNRACCDFVLYFKVGKTPLGVIEVDGQFHASAVQSERDALKDSILMKGKLPLLRLKTIEGQIEKKVAAFLAQWASNPQA